MLVALIPARAGSKRIPGKNTKPLSGKPLIEWTLQAARASSIFDKILLCSDDPALEAYARRGVEFVLREPSLDTEPDIQWVRTVLSESPLTSHEAFAILRPTSPFRSDRTIVEAWRYFQEHQPADSLRAVRYVNEPPQKMWVLTLGGRMVPLLPFHHPRTDSAGPIVPWHSSPTQSLPAFVVQTAALEIAWRRTVFTQHSISGTAVLPYFMPEHEQLDINTPADWERAEAYASRWTYHPTAKPMASDPYGKPAGWKPSPTYSC